MILYLDMVSGIAGDMALGALVDLGVPLDWLSAKLAPVLDGFELRSEIVFPSHLRAVNLHVDVTDHKAHRHYADIRAMIENGDLPEKVKANALAAFKKIALAEAHIHGKDIDHVHFHEIGGIDSLVDIIGTFLGMDYLGVSRVVASKIPLGSGTIECAHGTIPVPVPATLAVLKGLPVTQSDAKTEIVTPTGAAIVATLAEAFGSMPEMEITKTGYGAGKRDTGASTPNILRMVLGRPVENAGRTDQMPGEHILRDRVMVIHTHVDDMNPEILGFVMDRLLEKGALDVSFTPIFMKKNRPATRLEVICREDDLDEMAPFILTQTTAIGLRYKVWDRMVLPRETMAADTDLGRIQVKKIIDPNGDVRILPEYEDCRKKALDHDLPLHRVYERVQVQANPLNPLDREGAPIIQNQDGKKADTADAG
ncbi:MAG: nickel pincer cofactor biosynthesis protein LarC [Desulfobacter sp.]|nr:MAG: nickel pincer cofactor biosynthesis protein LarC [Desulfobacter sp.]